MSSSRNKTVKRRGRKHTSLEETLLTEKERAALKVIRGDGSDAEDDEESNTCLKLQHNIRNLLCNGGFISIIFMFILFLIGLILYVLSAPPILEGGQFNVEVVFEIAPFIVYGGLFGALGGLSNFLVLILLFYKIPLLYGSGVLKRKHAQISDILRKVVLQLLFDSEHLERYFIQRINQFSVDTNIVECITRAINSRTSEKIVDIHLNRLYKSPDAFYLLALGVTRERLKPMIGPAILSLCAEAAPVVLGQFHSRDSTTVSVPDIREAMDQYLRHRVQDLSSQTIAQCMKDIMFRHLSGLIIFGSITGCFLGFVIQGLNFTIHPVLRKHLHNQWNS